MSTIYEDIKAVLKQNHLEVPTSAALNDISSIFTYTKGQDIEAKMVAAVAKNYPKADAKKITKQIFDKIGIVTITMEPGPVIPLKWK